MGALIMGVPWTLKSNPAVISCVLLVYLDLFHVFQKCSAYIPLIGPGYVPYLYIPHNSTHSTRSDHKRNHRLVTVLLALHFASCRSSSITMPFFLFFSSGRLLPTRCDSFWQLLSYIPHSFHSPSWRKVKHNSKEISRYKFTGDSPGMFDKSKWNCLVCSGLEPGKQANTGRGISLERTEACVSFE